MIVCVKLQNYSNSRQKRIICVVFVILCIGKEVTQKENNGFEQIKFAAAAAAAAVLRIGVAMLTKITYTNYESSHFQIH